MMADLQLLPIAEVHDSPTQPRLGMSAEIRASVKAGIEASGGTYPAHMAIVVRPRADGGYEILSGHHRTRAAREFGVESIWASVLDLDDKAARLYQLASNNQRGMTTIEVGKHAYEMRSEFGMSVGDYARAIGKSETTVYTYIQAYEVLKEYGGIKGPYAKTPTQALVALHGLEDKPFVDGLLAQFGARGTTGPMAEKVVKLCRDGMPMWRAFSVAEGREDPAVMASGPSSGSHRLGAKRGKQAAGFDVVEAVSKNEAAIAVLERTVALLQARDEEFEARFGGRLKGIERDLFNNAVSARFERIKAERLKEMEHDGTLRKPKGEKEAG